MDASNYRLFALEIRTGAGIFGRREGEEEEEEAKNEEEEEEEGEGFSEVRTVRFVFEGTELEERFYRMWLQVDGK